MKTTKDYYFDRKIILENLLIQDDQSRQQQQVVPKMLVVIDQKVGDYKILAAGVKSGAKVLILDSHRDGVEQITVALQEHIEISSIHIVSHGSPGCLYLGNSQLSLDTLNQYAPQLRSWFSPALLLYGCNVACKDAGVEFIERLNQLTGAKIAASATPTGNKALGGNWELEVTTDEMAVSLAFAIALQESYSGVLASGDLDSSFGNNPTVTSDISFSSDEARIVALQTDGKIVVVEGRSNSIPGDLVLARYDSDASLDNSFGDKGIVTIDIVGSLLEGVNSIALQLDGKIILVGQTNTDNSANFALVRYNSDGSLDTSFGSNGVVTTNLEGDSDLASSVVLQPDGKIILVGKTNTDNSANFALVRYNSDGSLDTSFGSNGVVTTNLEGDSDLASGATLQPDGKIILVGQTNTDNSANFALVRYNSDGSLDTSFGSNGVVTTNLEGDSDLASGVTLQPDGKIILVGQANTDNSANFALVRYNSDGSLDTSFGTNDIATTDTVSNPDNFGGTTLQSDGKILLAGSSFNENNFNFNLVRYNSDGSIDTSFGSNGIVTVGGSNQAYNVAFGADGRIIAVGDINDQLVVVAYNSSEETFSIHVSDEASTESEGTLTINTINNIGDVTINGGSFNIDVGGVITPSSSVSITSNSNVTVDKINPINSGGGAGSLTIETPSLTITNGANVTVSDSNINVVSNIDDILQRNISTDNVDNTEPINAGGNITINADSITSISAVDNTNPINAGGSIVVSGGSLTITNSSGSEITPDDINTISNDSVFFLNKTPEDYFVLIGSPNQGSLQFTLTGRDTSFVNEVGVFIADDLQGRIDGIAPGDPSYLQATLERGQVIFSSLADNVFPELNSTRQLSFDTETRLGFYLVQNDTTDNVLADLAAGRTSTNVFLNFSDANPDNFDYLEVSPLEENSFQLNWEDSFAEGEVDFNDLVLTVEITDNSPSLGTQLQGGQQAELIDLRDQITGIVEAEFVINSDAAFDNSFGFYVVDNPSGSIGSLNPGDSGYAQAAVSNRVDLASGLPGKALLAPFLIADATPKEFLITNPNNQSGQGPLAYFAYMEANSDGFDHVRLLGDNLFGFEDLEGGGDADYNDLVVAVNFL
ncbi:MAG: DUF4347 domain-containing protein [Symploca sp. SIO2B6]|nr:DUF4347 domain-containing protein [Symploca sp. SIO2B6]